MNLNLRPRPNHVMTDALEFQLLSVEVCDDPVKTFDTNMATGMVLDVFYPAVEETPPNVYPKCTVCVFGVTATGASVAVRVAGFRPHFYVEITSVVTAAVLNRFVREVTSAMRLDKHDVRLTYEYRKRVYGWVPKPGDVSSVREFQFARLSFTNTVMMRRVANRLTYKSTNGLRLLDEDPAVSELRVAASEKFMAARGLKPCGWVRMEGGQYREAPRDRRVSVSQIEVGCMFGAMRPVKRDVIPPLVIAAMDIEVQSSDFRSMPHAGNEGDSVTYIGTTFWVYGDTEPRARVMQVHGTCDKLSDPTIHVMTYKSEYELLVGWRDLIAVHTNPDMMVSYNATGFDFPYMQARVTRAMHASRMELSRFHNMGRLIMHAEPLCERELTSAAKGQNIIAWFPQSGRVQMDLYMYVKDSQKLSSYKLDDVCAAFLGDTGKVVLDSPGWVAGLLPCARTTLVGLVSGTQQQDVSVLMDEAARACPSTGDYTACHRALQSAMDIVSGALQGVDAASSEKARCVLDAHVQPALDASSDNNYRRLFRMHVSGPGPRAAIVQYCQVDCDLVVRLVDRLNVVANQVQMSQVCNTLLNDVCNRGQQIKTFNLIAREAHTRGYVMNQRPTGWDPEAEYEGATVLEPTVGYYTTPVATLDFASLYPSLMRGFNLCFSSLVLDDEYRNLPGVKYGRYPIAGKTWVFQESTPGLLPDILSNLLDARRAKKREMRTYAKGSMQHRLCDGAQLALKVSCNSVYGFCGVINNGMFPCLPVAVATTFNGREAIAKTKAFVESKYSATVVYGDTDSVMLTFPGVDTVHAAFELGIRVAAETSAIFPDTVVLEFEKVFYPYLLMKRKTYSGLKYEDDPDAPPVLDVKGLAVVRRDNCALVRSVMKQVLNLIMRDNNPAEACEVVRRAVDDLVGDRVSLDQLQITSSLKSEESYKNPSQPQLTVVRNMRERRAFDVPRPGDRVPYVITHDPRKPRVSDRAEHPKYMAEHPEVRVDTEYYIVNQLRKRLEGILELLRVGGVDAIFKDGLDRVAARGIDVAVMQQFLAPGQTPHTPITRAVPRIKPVRMTRKAVDGSVNHGALDAMVRTREDAPPVTDAPPAKKPREKQDAVDQRTTSLASFFHKT